MSQLLLLSASIISSNTLLSLVFSPPALAEIIPDTTLPNNSRVGRQGEVQIIEGGAERGSNLFHSFEEFSISTGETAFFANRGVIENIFARVTGRNRSEIDGEIGANGTANLFLINPNGIIFGRNASLNIGGSFLASTANSINFADGTQFSAVNPRSFPLLTVSVPIGLQFGREPGAIRNEANTRFLDESGNPIRLGLQVPLGETLALVGGKINSPGGVLAAEDGRIEVGSVSNSELVGINLLSQGYALNYTDVQTFGNIRFANSSVSTSGDSGGSIQIQGRNITLVRNSRITSNNNAFGGGNSLAIHASGILHLISGGVFTQNFGSGNGSNISVNAARLLIEGGANLNSSTFASGNAGAITITASDSVEVAGIGVAEFTANHTLPSAIAAQVGGAFDKDNTAGQSGTIGIDTQRATGQGGTIRIHTQRLIVRDGAIIDATTFARGDAGDIHIIASDSINLLREPPQGTRNYTTSIAAQVDDAAPVDSGNAGDLRIETDQLNLVDGAQILTAARLGGLGGNIWINANIVQVNGTASDARFSQVDTTFTIGRSGIFVSAEPGATRNAGNLQINAIELTIDDRGEISANNSGQGQGGEITINANRLSIQNGGEIRANSFNRGAGGNLRINATEFVEVRGTGIIQSRSFPSAIAARAESAGGAGNVRITTHDLSIQNGAVVSVSGEGGGFAGDLLVNAGTVRLDQGRLEAATRQGSGANIRLQDANVVLLENRSLISARAAGRASGGDVAINTANGFVVGSGENNDIVANAFRGRGGNITIEAQSVLGLEERRSTPSNQTNDIDASSEFGALGSVTIIGPDVAPAQGLIELPTGFIDASNSIIQVCPTGNAITNNNPQNRFIVTGRGGLPPNADEALSSDAVQVDLVMVEDDDPASNLPTSSLEMDADDEAIVEAQGWVVDAHGDVVLIAAAPTVTPAHSQPTSICPL